MALTAQGTPTRYECRQAAVFFRYLCQRPEGDDRRRMPSSHVFGAGDSREKNGSCIHVHTCMHLTPSHPTMPEPSSPRTPHRQSPGFFISVSTPTRHAPCHHTWPSPNPPQKIAEEIEKQWTNMQCKRRSSVKTQKPPEPTETHNIQGVPGSDLPTHARHGDRVPTAVLSTML